MLIAFFRVTFIGSQLPVAMAATHVCLAFQGMCSTMGANDVLKVNDGFKERKI